MRLLSEGSVKNFWIEKMPTETELGVGLFEFTNDYSIFDWGKMPQIIPDKGEALKKETVHWFKRLEDEGIKTHFIEDVDRTKIKVKAFRKLEYDQISQKSINYMLPLEVIFRNKITPASSLFRRLKAGTVDPEAYGLPKNFKPDEGVILLPKPVVEFSTKIEEVDRYIKDSEAASLAKISMSELMSIKETTLEVNRIITEEVKKRDLDHIDGKIEVAFGPKRDIYVCDTVGTSDENRFHYKGLDLSKQMLRDYYKLNGWYADLSKARENKTDLPKPPLMDDKYLKLVNDAYKALCNGLTGESWGDVEPQSLDFIVKSYKDFFSA